jgi:hypothetical protein
MAPSDLNSSHNLYAGGESAFRKIENYKDLLLFILLNVFRLAVEATVANAPCGHTHTHTHTLSPLISQWISDLSLLIHFLI